MPSQRTRAETRYLPMNSPELAGAPPWEPEFAMGELLMWKGITFRVVAIGSPGILLEAAGRRVTVVKGARKR